jgi:integrase
MGRPRKQNREPFWREARKCWYVQQGSTQIRLDPDRDEAWRKWHELMARPPEGRQKPRSAPKLVVEILDAFLGWAEANRGPRTYDWYRERLQIFAEAIPATLAIADLRPFHVTRVMDTRGKGWTNNGRHNLARAVQRAFNWAEKQGLIDRSPIRHVEKPPMEAREVCVTPADYGLALEHARGGFRDLIRFAWESGARPQEIVAIEARHVDAEQSRVVFPRDEAKGGKAMRVMYLTGEALAILGPLIARNPEGPLFRTASGSAWRGDSVNCAFCRLKKKIGKKLHLGAFRKGFTTEALKNGVDTLTTSHLLGHVNGVMVGRVYGKVQQDPEFMRRSMERAKGKPG